MICSLTKVTLNGHDYHGLCNDSEINLKSSALIVRKRRLPKNSQIASFVTEESGLYENWCSLRDLKLLKIYV